MTARAVRTYLQMTRPSDLEAPESPDAAVRVEQAVTCPPSLWRRLYTDVGRDYQWVDRLAWTDDEIARYLADPAVEFWLLKAGSDVWGYFELRRDAEGGVEIAYVGLLPAFIGRGLGKFLLAAAVRRAWALDPARVWVHTSSLDHPSALPNYLARGFTVWKQEVYDV